MLDLPKNSTTRYDTRTVIDTRDLYVIQFLGLWDEGNEYNGEDFLIVVHLVGENYRGCIISTQFWRNETISNTLKITQFDVKDIASFKEELNKQVAAMSI
jgi:hypothetical protein